MDSETSNYDLFNEAIVKHLGLSGEKFNPNQQTPETEMWNWNGYYVPVITKVEPFGLLDYVFSYTKVAISKQGAMLMPSQGKIKSLTYQGNHLFSMRDRTNISHSFYKTADGALHITDGITTIKRISGLAIIGIAVSLMLGVTGMLYLFIFGCRYLIKYKLNFRKHPVFWVFISLLTLLISILFIATQPFMRMGDITIGNVLLAASTYLLPLFSFVPLVSSFKKQRNCIYSVSFWAIIFVIQFCVLLVTSKLMPIIMWK